MKRTFSLITALTIALMLASCDGPNNTVNQDADSTTNIQDTADANTQTGDTEKKDDGISNPETGTAIAPATYNVPLDNGVIIEIGAPANGIISALGEPLDYMEAPSCVHEGYDKVYAFAGYNVNTAPDASGNDIITELSILSDTVALENGFTIGSSADDATAVFGNNFTEQFGVRTYMLSSVIVSILLDGDVVTGITISANN